MSKFRLMLSTVVVGFFVVASGSRGVEAASVNLVKDLNSDYKSVQGVRKNSSTYATDFIGMSITATYVDGGSEDLTFVRSGAYRASISGGDIGLSFVNYGFSLVSNTRRLQSLTLDLAPAGAIFDTASLLEGAVGNTPTTKIGSPFHITGGDLLDTDVVNVDYSGLVRIAGFEAGVDAFTNLLIDFSDTAGGGLLGSFSFGGDTDALEDRNDLTPVPLPAGFLLLLQGLGIFAVFRARKSRKRAPLCVPA